MKNWRFIQLNEKNMAKTNTNSRFYQFKQQKPI